MKRFLKSWKYAFIVGPLCLAVLLLANGMNAKEPVKSEAVIALEKEMASDVPVFNTLAPRLKKNRAALEALGWSFDDSTLKAVFQ